MPKNGLFFRKNCKIRRSVGGSAPKPPFGLWGGSEFLRVTFLFYYCNFKILNLLLMGHKIFCFQAQGYPSYATDNMTSFSPPSPP